MSNNFTDGLRSLFKGKDSFSRQIMLFSICGTIGLLDVYLSIMEPNNLNIYSQIIFGGIWVLFGMFVMGYEVVFLHERELPDIDFRPLKILLKKPLVYFLLFIIPLSLVKLFPQYMKIAFILEMLLAVPLTMIQAGFSYNYSNSETFKLFEDAKLKDFVVLFFKRIGLIILGYLFVSIVVFILFFILGFVIAVVLRGNSDSLILLLSSQQFIIVKLSNFISGILLIYVLTNATLLWDYDLIKTYEREEK